MDGEECTVTQKKVCLIGTFAVGKTSLVERFVESIFSERYRTTVGVRIFKKTVDVGEQPLSLIIWDLAGEDELVVLREEYLRGASGYILVADGTRRHTLDKAIDLHDRARATLGAVPFVLAVNKSDRSEDWAIDESVLEERAGMGWPIVMTSAKSGRGVEEVFHSIAKRVSRG
jgi:small GTP-binding protein